MANQTPLKYIVVANNVTALSEFQSTDRIPAGLIETYFAPLQSPALITPSLGTPTSGNLVNCTFPVSIHQYAINNQTNTTYGPVLTDASKLVTLSNASSINVVVPTNASVPFPIGTTIDFIQTGVGQVTFSAAAGATVDGTPSLLTRARYSGVSLIKAATDTWYLIGDLA